MDGVAQATLPTAPALPPVSISPPTPETADLTDLEPILGRFDRFPDWLRRPLCDYAKYRWGNWLPHMAASHARRLACNLDATWDWLLRECALPNLSALQRSHVAAWLNARQEAGLAASTLGQNLAALRAFLFFIEERGTPVSPNIFRIPYPKRPHPLPRYLAAVAYQRLFRVVFRQTEADTRRNRLDRAWFLTLAHTGLCINCNLFY